MRRLNKLLALALALLLAFTLAACGDSFESAMVRALREMQNVESVHADMALDMSFGVDVLGESTSMDIAMDMGMDTAGDLTSGELTMTMLGIPITVTYIVEKNGDAYDIYLSTDGGSTWESQTGLTEEQLTSGGNYSPVHRTGKVYAPLRSVQSRRPPDVLHPRQGAKAAFDGRNGCQKCFLRYFRRK